MSKEKQIEEMAGALKFCKDTSIDECHTKKDCHHCISEQIYNAGFRKQSEGQNIAKYYESFECSVCHFSDWDTKTADTAEYNFCPNCGAKMKEKADG